MECRVKWVVNRRTLCVLGWTGDKSNTVEFDICCVDNSYDLDSSIPDVSLQRVPGGKWLSIKIRRLPKLLEALDRLKGKRLTKKKAEVNS